MHSQEITSSGARLIYSDKETDSRLYVVSSASVEDGGSLCNEWSGCLAPCLARGLIHLVHRMGDRSKENDGRMLYQYRDDQGVVSVIGQEQGAYVHTAPAVNQRRRWCPVSILQPAILSVLQKHPKLLK